MCRLLAVTWCLLLAHCLLDQVQAARRLGTLKKCCPVNQSLIYDDDHNDFVCTNTTTNETEWSWLPVQDLHDANLLDKINVSYGFPKCHIESRDILYTDRNHNADNAFEEFTITVNDTDFLMSVSKYTARHHDDVEHPTMFTASVFCVDLAPDDMHIAVLCPCEEVKCVRKCCADKMAFNKVNMTCQEVADKKIKYWLPVLESTEDAEPVYYRLADKAPLCDSEHRALVTYKSQEEKNASRNLMLLGNFSLKSLSDNRIYPVDDYCADFDVNYGEVVQFCSRPDTTLETWYRVYSTFFLIGTAALLLTVILMIWLPELRQTLHQRMALAHNIMLLIGNGTVGVGQWSTTGFSITTCKATSFVIQISLLATFFWLNSMSINIAWMSSGLKQNRGTSRSVTRKFMWFALYSWGSTCVISSIMAVFEFTPSITVLKPRFGERNCFFSDPAARWLFLYGPIGVILLVNFVLFVYTSARILIVKKKTAIISEADSSKNAGNKQNFLIFTKLFFLMGLTWVTEILGMLIGGSIWAWVTTDIINLLEGVFIFIIFCCNRTVYNLVREKLRHFLNRVGIDQSEEGKSIASKTSSLEMNKMNASDPTAAARPVAGNAVAPTVN